MSGSAAEGDEATEAEAGGGDTDADPGATFLFFFFLLERVFLPPLLPLLAAAGNPGMLAAGRRPGMEERARDELGFSPRIMAEIMLEPPLPLLPTHLPTFFLGLKPRTLTSRLRCRPGEGGRLGNVPARTGCHLAKDNLSSCFCHNYSCTSRGLG